MSVLIAARTLGDLSAWRLTNLQMQKLLYVAQIIHLGRTGEPLFPEGFEAWSFGPVVPGLYRALKENGSRHVKPLGAQPFAPGTTHHSAIAEAVCLTRGMTGPQLVDFAHRQGGAWRAAYHPLKRNAKIANQALKDEFMRDFAPSQAAIDWAMEAAEENARSPSKYLDDTHERAFRSRLQQDAARARRGIGGALSGSAN